MSGGYVRECPVLPSGRHYLCCDGGECLFCGGTAASPIQHFSASTFGPLEQPRRFILMREDATGAERLYDVVNSRAVDL